jgi:hypothetical protein
MEECKHNEGFHLRMNVQESGYPGVYCCNRGCGFFLTFDPEYAGAFRPPVDKDKDLDIYSPNFWGNMLIGYTSTAPEGKKDGPRLSTGGKY